MPVPEGSLTLCVRETENIIGFEYGSFFLGMVYVNTYNNENNGSCPVLCQYLFENVFFTVVDEKSITDGAFSDCFLVNQLLLRFNCLTITQSKLILHSHKT